MSNHLNSSSLEIQTLTRFGRSSMQKLLATSWLLMFGVFSSTLQSKGDANPAENITNSLQLPTMTLFQKSETFRFKALPKPFVLKHPPVLRDSEKVLIAGETLLRQIDYHIDYTAGAITIERTFPDDALVEIAYETLPFTIKKLYKRDLFRQAHQHRVVKLAIDKTSIPIRQTSEQSTTTPSQLRVAGTQTFGISVGSGRSLSQNQELRISVDGKVSENVNVIALLSDRNLPIQDSGTTEDIQDIDQKLIRVTSPKMTATLGDFEAPLGNSEFVFFPRALEGVQIEGNFKWGKFHLIPGSIPKGESTTKTIRGKEGQSEYRIDADGKFVVVKAGSEIVWLNGKRMRRGQNNDYVIREYGDAILEFTSKHLITSNDTIRVDFEFIPENRIYHRNLYGASGLFNLPGNLFSIGFGYAVESDLNDSDNTSLILNEQEFANLRQDELNPDINRRQLVPPKKHSVWGLDGRLNLGDQTSAEGQIAFSALDKNTFSTKDAKELSRAWKFLAFASNKNMQLNLNCRSIDARFVPVGASATNRTRFQYEEQYREERFSDLYLFDAVHPPQPPDEKSIDFDFQFTPVSWLRFNSGLGRREEDFVVISTPSSEGQRSGQGTGLLVKEQTIRNNLNWRVDFSPKNIPNLKWNTQRSASKVKGTDQFLKTHQQWNVSHRFHFLNMNGSIEQLESQDLDFTDGINLNRKRNISTGRMDIVDSKWTSINTQYSLEESFRKEDLLTVDGDSLGFSMWKLETIARTWRIGLFSQPRNWANLSTNISHRIFQARKKFSSDSTTQLADISLRLTPFNRALYSELTYELDKRLATERREIYSNINPFTGREIQPGDGLYVKIDNLHYREDVEEGNYIRLIQNVDDKPVCAIDVKLRLRFRPRQFFSHRQGRIRRFRNPRTNILPTDARASFSGESVLQTESTSDRASILERLAQALSAEIRLDIREEQEETNTASLYLLRDLRTKQTLFGQGKQRYQLKFSPSTKLNINLNFNRSQTLNRRINNRERWRASRNWDIHLTFNPTRRVSFGGRCEQRREREEFSQLGLNVDLPEKISDLVQFERTGELDFQYELNRTVRFSMTGNYEITSDRERIAHEPESKTQTFAIANQLTYALIGKGRIELNYRLGYGNRKGGTPFARYNFYEGISHKMRANADYKIRKATDLLLRLKYRFLSTEHRSAEHRFEAEVVAEL